ncbi:hypothetical protein GQR58_027928 [Nymphon striatum]|nr:hypothetical protein GQR58_027928 [Nymphon striatum]
MFIFRLLEGLEKEEIIDRNASTGRRPYSKSMLINVQILRLEVKPFRLSCKEFDNTTNLAEEHTSSSVKKAAQKPDAVSSRQLHSEAFKTISDFINTEMIQNNKVMLVSSVQDLYEAEYCSLGGREDDIAVYSIQALTRKLKDTFEDKILLSNYTKRQGNFLYSSSMSKVDARARFHGDEVKSKLQDMIRSTALHLRSLIHAIPKWKTPMPTSVHTLKTCSPWLPEDLFLFYKTLMCGLREPTGDQNCQGMQRKVLSMSSDADNPLANIKKFDCALLPPCTKPLQNKIRRAHYVSITWGNAEASTPTDGLDPEKYGWKMENGCLVPDWFDGPVIPADLFHDKEDTNVDTGDQQAVDDAEYDDGSSTDSKWSDDSIGEEQYDDFVKYRITSKDIGLHEPISRNKVKLFGNFNRKIVIKKSSKEKSIESNRNILGTLLAISARNERAVNFKTALCYPLCPVPLSLANPDGSRKATAKSKLQSIVLKYSKELVQHPRESLPQNEPSLHLHCTSNG